MKPADTINPGVFDLPREQHIQPSLIQLRVSGNPPKRTGGLQHFQGFFEGVAVHAGECETYFAVMSSDRVIPEKPISRKKREDVGMDSVEAIFARNLARLMEHKGEGGKRMSAKKVAALAGVSDRAVGMYLNQQTKPTIDMVEKIAKGLGYSGWELLMPDFDPVVMKDRRFDALCHTYVKADSEGRRVMDTQAEYITRRDKPADNDPNGHTGSRSAG